MKWNKSILLSVILFMAAAFLSFLRLWDVAYLRSQYTSVSIRYTKEGATKKSLDTALENEVQRGAEMLPEITAWKQLKEKKIRNDEFDRTAKVWVNVVEGDMAQTAPMTLVHGSYVYSEDKKGCVIDTVTAYELFGTKNAVGNVLQYQGSDYHIRGVVKAGGCILLIEGKDDSEAYANLEIVYKDKERGQSLAEDFLQQNGLTQDYVIMDGCIYARMLSAITALPLWLFFTAICYYLLRYLWRIRSRVKLGQYVIYSLSALLLVAGYGLLLYRFTGNPVYLPDKFLPSRFSDFDYWGRQFQSVKEQLTKLRYIMPNLKDVRIESELSKLSLNITLMIVLYIATGSSCLCSIKKKEQQVYSQVEESAL